jgi:tRNA pseudouridine55 synthase
MDFTQNDFEDGQLLFIDKPYKWTSFDVVNKIKQKLKRLYGKKIKVGHAGTLDPLATGLLIICTGKFTKKIEEFQNFDKEYIGEFFLGATTPSFDCETSVDKIYDISHITNDIILKTACSLTGTFNQIPPAFSAKKIDGKRAYEFARTGQDVVLKSNTVTIKKFEILNINLPIVKFKILCTKGTYIRAIARDFGYALNSGAYMSSLRRTKIGDFDVNDAISIENI